MNKQPIIHTPVVKPKKSTVFIDDIVVYNSQEYSRTDEIIPSSEIGKQVGVIKRIGHWNERLDGDSTYFPYGDPIFEILGQEPITYIAIGELSGKEGQGGIYRYVKLVNKKYILKIE